MCLLTCPGTATAQREDVEGTHTKMMVIHSWRESLGRCVYQDKARKGQARNCSLEKTMKESYQRESGPGKSRCHISEVQKRNGVNF